MRRTLVDRIYSAIVKAGGQLHLQNIYNQIRQEIIEEEGKNVANETLRAAIYKTNKYQIDRIGKGLYAVPETINGENVQTLIIEGDGRNLEHIPAGSINAIITDHPWEDKKSLTSRNKKNFAADYEDTCFRYTIEDFKEKARVLKDGAFLVEMVPEESATNWEYLMNIKLMAKECGFRFYCRIPCEKVGEAVNTGRKKKYGYDIMFFTKGEPRRLSAVGKPYMTSSMLPSIYRIKHSKYSEKVHQAEKPITLYESIIEAITLPGEVVLDQFAGSGNCAAACKNTGRLAIVIELLSENIQRMVKRLGAVQVFSEEALQIISA